MHRRLLILVAMACASFLIAGCATDPAVRMESLKIDSENRDEFNWRGGWLNGQSEEPTPYRIHGGVGPASSSI